MIKEIYYQFYKLFLSILSKRLDKYLRENIKWPNFRNNILTKKTINIEMRDKINLSTDVYLPDSNKKVASILIRLPYDKKAFGIIYENYVRYGYALIIQDSRGCFESEGVFDHFKNEKNDGLDTIKWIEKQKWFNGKLALMGASYLVLPQLAIATEAPKCLKCIIPQFMTTDFYSIAFWSGLFRVHIGIFYGLAVKDKTKMVFPTLNKVKKIGLHLPFKDIDKTFYQNDSLFEFAMNNPFKNKNWENIINVNNFKKNPIPALYIAGWYDLYCQQQIDDYNRHILLVKDHKQTKLIIGPWTHLPFPSRKKKEFPDSFYNFQKMIIDWLDYNLKDKKNINWGPVRYYHTGVNTWNDKEKLLDPMQITTILFLNKSNKKTHKLNNNPDTNNNYLSYIYNPKKPINTKGGAYLTIENSGIRIQKKHNLKNILIFESDKFLKDYDIRGKIKLELWIKTNVVNTPFIARLSIVKNKKVWFLNESGILLSHSNNKEKTKYTPGTTIKIVIEFPTIIHRIFKNERIRLDISSSSYPAFNQYPNCEIEKWSSCKEPIKAIQTIFMSKKYKSKLILPGEYIG